MADQPACAHTIIDHIGEDWVCRTCPTQFVPITTLDTLMDQQINIITDVSSSILYRTLERIYDAKGIEDGTDAPKGEMFEYTPEMEHEHEWNGGQCIHCGTPQWLGA